MENIAFVNSGRFHSFIKIVKMLKRILVLCLILFRIVAIILYFNYKKIGNTIFVNLQKEIRIEFIVIILS